MDPDASRLKRQVNKRSCRNHIHGMLYPLFHFKNHFLLPIHDPVIVEKEQENERMGCDEMR